MLKINETIINPNYIVMIEPGIGPAYEGKYILQMFNTQKNSYGRRIQSSC